MLTKLVSGEENEQLVQLAWHYQLNQQIEIT